MRKELTKTAIKKIIREVAYWGNIKLTKTQLFKLVGYRKNWLYMAYYDYGMDTCMREELLSIISRNLINEEWPTIGDGKKVWKRFVKKMIKALDEQKIEHDLACELE